MRLFVTEKAQKDLARLDKQTQGRIKTALDNMAKDINTVDLRKLKGAPDRWRLRVGDYRVLLLYSGEEATVYALRIKHRKDAYK